MVIDSVVRANMSFERAGHQEVYLFALIYLPATLGQR